VNGLAVFECNYAQDARCGVVWQGDLAPMADAVIGLHFASDRVGDHGATECDGQVGALPQDLFVEVARGGHQRCCACLWRSINARICFMTSPCGVVGRSSASDAATLALSHAS